MMQMLVTVTDGDLSDSATFTLTVNPVNDAPTLDDLADSNGQEDSDFVLELSGADVDGDALTFLASVDANGSVSVDGSTLTVSPAADYNGDIVVSVIASDGQASGSGSFTLNVSPVNDAPVLATFDDQEIDEDTSLTFELSATDIDNTSDELSYEVVNGGADISINGTTVTLTPEANYFGDADVTVTVTDGDLSDSATFTLTVNPVNDHSVVVSPIEDLEVDEDSDDVVIDLRDVFDDVENGSNLAFSFSENVSAMDASLNGSILTLSFLENENGFGSVTISASDVVSRLSVQDSFDVVVSPVNDAPTANTANAEGDEDSAIGVELSGSDIDGDALTFSLGSDASNGSVTVMGATATYTPAADFNGSDSFTFIANDGLLSSEAVVSVTVNPVNDAPTFVTSSLGSVDEDVAYSIILDVNDIDNTDDDLKVFLFHLVHHG